MTPEEREAYYDAEVAPKLKAIAEACKERGLSFLAVVEWTPGSHGETRYLSEPFGDGIKLADLAARSHGNIDAMAMALAREVNETGRPHNSIVLDRIGVPSAPSSLPSASR